MLGVHKSFFLLLFEPTGCECEILKINKIIMFLSFTLYLTSYAGSAGRTGQVFSSLNTTSLAAVKVA